MLLFQKFLIILAVSQVLAAASARAQTPPASPSPSASATPMGSPAPAATPMASPAPAATPMASPASATPMPSEPVTTERSPHAWQYSVTPYLWAPNLNGTLTFSHAGRAMVGIPPFVVNLDVHVGPSTYLTHLNSAAMFTAEGHNDYWGLFTDFIYLNLSASNANVTTVTGPNGRVELPINVSTSTRMSGGVYTLAGEIPIPWYSGKYSSFDAFAGARYLSVNASADWQLSGPLDILDASGSASRSESLVDPIFGFRGRLGLGSPQWYVPYYGDFGVNNSSQTWQGVLGFGYHFRGGDIVLVNRWLNYYTDGGLIKGVEMVGPTLGYKINF